MASSPDLYVVCKNCGAEVSPYITECPYCGARLRKRAPKIERDGTVSEPKPKKQKRERKAPRLARPARERPAVRYDTRPWATLTLVVLSLFGFLVLSVVARADIAVAGPIGNEWWRVAASPFVYGSAWYELAAVVAIGVYGWLLERRHGPVVVVALFLLCRARGEEYDGDLLGTLVLALLLLLMPLAVPEASAIAGFAGGAAGLLCGLALARTQRV